LVFYIIINSYNFQLKIDNCQLEME
jgi:hypothetical protein